MEKQDFVYITQDKCKELRDQFYNLWRNEPVKLNAFVNGGELAFYDLTIVIITKNVYTMTIDYHYSKNQKKLTCIDEQNGYQGECKNMYIMIDNFWNTTHKGELKNDIVVGYRDRRDKQRLWDALRLQNKNPADWISDLAIFFFMFNLIALSLPHKLKESTEKANKTIQVKKGGSKSYKSVVYLKHIYTFDKDFKITKSDVKHIIKCPAWGVRGHKRHLKSGKIIYIKPFVKGKYRNDASKYVGKEYRIDVE